VTTSPHGGLDHGVHGNVSDMDAEGHFIDLITFEIGGEEPQGVDRLRRLIAGRKAVWTVHEVTGRASQWEQVCAIERDLLAAHAESGWTIVAGTAEGYDEVRGWLIYDDHVLVPLGPKGQREHGVDIAAFALEEWSRVAEVRAAATVTEESAIVLNRQIRDSCSS
jgi:hypothetical protein